MCFSDQERSFVIGRFTLRAPKIARFQVLLLHVQLIFYWLISNRVSPHSDLFKVARNEVQPIMLKVVGGWGRL
jgi:hypothetical protein